MVCRGGQARRRRHHSAAERRPAHPGREAAGRRCRGHHAVELPAGDARPQDRAGAGRRLHRCLQARRRHAADRAGHGRLLEEAGVPPGWSTSSPRRANAPSALADVWLADARVRKITFTGSTAVGKHLAREGAGTLKKPVAGAGRQCALHRLRRRRPRRRGRRRDGREVPQRRPDLRLSEPDLRAAGRLRPLHRQARRAVGALTIGPASGGRRRHWAADQRAGSRQGRAACADALAQGAQLVAGGRHRARCAGGHFYAPTVLVRRHRGHAHVLRGNLRPGRARHAIRHRSRSRSRSPTPRRTAWPRISIRATSTASGAWPKRSKPAWWRSTTARCRPSSRRSAASRIPAIGREGSHYGLDDYLNIKYIRHGSLRRIAPELATKQGDEHVRQSIQGGAGGRRPQIGLWLSLANAYTAEVCATAGFDWLLLDCEHAPNDVRGCWRSCRRSLAYPSHPVVRPVTGDVALIKQLLDIGAQTLLVPMVDTAEQAAQLVAATRYPPEGIRGVGSAAARASRWGRAPTTSTAPTTRSACWCRPRPRGAGEHGRDLRGRRRGRRVHRPGRPRRLDGPSGRSRPPRGAGRHRGCHAPHPACGKAAGTLASDDALARRYLELGCTYVAVGLDVRLLAMGARALCAEFVDGAQAQPASAAGAVY